MIKESDLREAIAECQGERNPDAKTCIKLAAYYTILNNISPQEPQSVYSHAEPPEQVSYESGTEFAEVIRGKDILEVLGVIDELLGVVEAIAPRLYVATMEKLKK